MTALRYLPICCLSLALPLGALAEGSEPSDRTVERSFTTTKDRDVTQNEDGSRTVNTTVTHTDDQTGRSATRETSATVTKAEDGRSWSSSTTQTGPRGGTLETTGSGSVTKNEDGSKTVSRTSTTANPKTGESVTHTVDRTATKTDDGVEWTTDRSTDTSRGGHFESTTTGAAKRDEDGSGGSYSAHTTGSGTGAAGKERSWESDRSGSWQKNDQGGRDFQGSKTTTTGDGHVLRRDRSGETVRNADGSKTTHVKTTRSGDAPAKRGWWGRRPKP